MNAASNGNVFSVPSFALIPSKLNLKASLKRKRPNTRNTEFLCHFQSEQWTSLNWHIMNHENVFSAFGLQLIYVYIRAALLNGRLWANFERKLFKCLCVRLNGNFAPHPFYFHIFFFSHFFFHFLSLLSVFFLYFLKPLMHFRSAYLPIWNRTFRSRY